MSYRPLAAPNPQSVRNALPARNAPHPTQFQSQYQHSQEDDESETSAHEPPARRCHPAGDLVGYSDVGPSVRGSPESFESYPSHQGRSSPYHTGPAMAKDYRLGWLPTPPAKPFALHMSRTRSPQRRTPQSSPQGTPQSKFVTLPSTSPQAFDASYVSLKSLVSPPTPPFRPILLSRPLYVKEQAQVIVKLETATEIFKTTFRTLTSRNSLLDTLLREVVNPHEEADVTRTGEDDPDSMSSFGSMFHEWFPSTTSFERNEDIVHVFLDRPAKPYAHILTYLRADGLHLPHAVTLTHNLEDLVELRDEARFLKLDDLAHLCAEELLQHPLVRSHAPPATHISPVGSARTAGLSKFSPAPLVTHMNSSHAVHIVVPEHGPRSANARQAYI